MSGKEMALADPPYPYNDTYLEGPMLFNYLYQFYAYIYGRNQEIL